MKALQLVAIMTMLVSFTFVTTASAEYYIVQNNMGSRAVTDALPGYGWSIIFGPYATKDAAERDMGTGTGRLPGDISGVPAPSVTRSGEIVPEFLAAEEFEFVEVPAPQRRVGSRERAEAPIWQREAAAGRERMEAPVAESADMAVFALKGKAAIDIEGKDIGRFDHLVVSRDGKVDYVVLAHNSKFIPIPWQALDVSSQKDALVVHMDKNRMANAPSFDRKDFLQTLTMPDFRDKVYSFYEARAPRAEAAEMPKMSAPEMQKPADKAAAMERDRREAETHVEGSEGQKMDNK